MRCARGNPQIYGGGKDNPSYQLMELGPKKMLNDADGHRDSQRCPAQCGFIGPLDWLGGIIGSPGYYRFRYSPDPFSTSTIHAAHTSDARDVEIDVLAQRNDEEPDDLVSTNELDDMANEQTWPAEKELNVGAMAAGAGESFPDAKKGTIPRAVHRVPKVASAYQAAWLIDEDDAL